MVKTKVKEKNKIRSMDDRIIEVITYVFVTLLTLTVLYPILNVIAVSMSSYTSYLKSPWMIVPYEFDFRAFQAVFGSSLIMRSYLNTIIITATGTFLTLFFTILTAYPLSRPGLKGKALFTSIVIFTMMFSGGTIPSFLLVKSLGLYDTLMAQILPGALSAFNVILMINNFRAMPESLLEAARVDGASEPYILMRIVIPLSNAIIACIALFAAVGYWNNYFSAVLYARKQSNWPVQLVLREIIMAANTAMLNADGNMAEMSLANIPTVSLRYASLIVVMVPIMCIYPFLQKYFTKGMMLGAVKG